ncbi:MAG: DUF1566 domain-containing protein [Bacteroidetes bacterium]|nr:DUF1566 domain-containing protein [Bacteroidota bacterium]
MKQFFTLLAAVLLTATTFAQVGVNNENPDASAALDITSTTGGLLVPRMTAAQRDAITATQGLIIFCSDCASGEGELQIKLTSSWKNTIGDDVNDPPPPAIGDTYQGGAVFYLDGNGGGLIAAPSDQSSAAWGCYGQSNGGTSSAVGTGAANTTTILGGCSETAIAARICADLTLGGYSDWFLPSYDELNLMYENIGPGDELGLGDIGNFGSNVYWSSTEIDNVFAWFQFFDNGGQNGVDKYYTFNVRAVRAF